MAVDKHGIEKQVRALGGRMRANDGYAEFTGRGARERKTQFLGWADDAGVKVSASGRVGANRYHVHLPGFSKPVDTSDRRGDDILARLRAIHRKTGAKLDKSGVTRIHTNVQPFRKYEVMFEIETFNAKGKSTGWETYKSKVAKGKTALEAAVNALKTGNPRPKEGHKFIYLRVRPDQAAGWAPDPHRDFGDFYAFRSVTNGKYTVRHGLPGDDIGTDLSASDV